MIVLAAGIRAGRSQGEGAAKDSFSVHRGLIFERPSLTFGPQALDNARRDYYLSN
jgi:hypothetical protein